MSLLDKRSDRAQTRPVDQGQRDGDREERDRQRTLARMNATIESVAETRKVLEARLARAAARRAS